MMEHVQAHRGKTQHLADVPVRAWRKVKLEDGSRLQVADNVLTLCGQQLSVAARMLENPQDCKRCRRAVEIP
jgi:hypothetical protein